MPFNSDESLSARLTEARKARGMSQAEAADVIGVSRPTFIAIEKGTRQPTPRELAALATAYGRNVNDLLRQRQPIGDLAPHFRAAISRLHEPDPNTQAAMDAAISEFQRLADDYRHVEELAGSPMRPNLPPEAALNPAISPEQLAEMLADRERKRLGMGDGPVPDAEALLEQDVGVRVFLQKLPSPISGMYAFVDGVGACVSVNRLHPPERQRLSLMHEFAHLIIDRYRPGVDSLKGHERKPANERFADRFAAAFMMPATQVSKHFHETLTASGDFRRADLLRLADYFGVSVDAMAWRMELVGLLPKGTALGMRESGFKIGDARAALGLAPMRRAQGPCSDRFMRLAVSAFLDEKLSEGELAKLLRVDRVEAREIVEQYAYSNATSSDGDDSRSTLPLSDSLLAGGRA